MNGQHCPFGERPGCRALKILVAEENWKWILGHWARQLAPLMDAGILRLPLSRRNIRTADLLLLKHRGAGSVLVLGLPVFARFASLLVRSGNPPKRPIFVYLTHLNAGDIPLIVTLNPLVANWIVMNSRVQRSLARVGVRSRLVIPGVDIQAYRRESWHTRVIDVTMAMDLKGRKNLPLAVDLLTRLDVRSKIFLKNSRKSDTSALFSGTTHRLEVLPYSLESYARTLASTRLVLSTSANEGGPMPLIEGLVSGTDFVASDTGFASDLVKWLNVGQVIPRGASAEEWMTAVRNVIASPVGPSIEPQSLAFPAFADRLRGVLRGQAASSVEEVW